MNETALRVYLVEDHPVLRGVLRDYITRLPSVRSCTVNSTAEDALKALDGDEPDLMLIDLSLPGMSGIDLVREVRRNHPELCCAILSGHRSRVYATQALAAGANGYMLKGDPLEIERGMQAMLAGERYVSRNLETES
jgi:DNA-binding NarL/FixJ family response regulator